MTCGSDNILGIIKDMIYNNIYSILIYINNI